MSAAQLLNPKAESRVGGLLNHMSFTEMVLTIRSGEEKLCVSIYPLEKVFKMSWLQIWVPQAL